MIQELTFQFSLVFEVFRSIYYGIDHFISFTDYPCWDFRLISTTKRDTFKFWLEYRDMVDLHLDFLAAERQSDWLLHLETFRDTLQTSFMGIIYLSDMERLPEHQPYLFGNFMDGHHTIKTKTTITFQHSVNRYGSGTKPKQRSKCKGRITFVSRTVISI